MLQTKAEELIANGVVIVNGETITQMGYIVDEENYKVIVNGKEISIAKKNLYYAFYKPTKSYNYSIWRKGS